MNAAGQIMIEFLLLMAIFLLVIASVAKEIPITFSQASPFLAGKLQQRLETGSGFAKGAWSGPVKPKGGVKE